MITLLRPSPLALERVRFACEKHELNAPGLGVDTLNAPATDFVCDAYGGLLGSGESTFTDATAAIDAYAMYPSPWTWVHTGPGPLIVGSVYVAVIRGYGLYSLLPGRVLEVFDHADPTRRYGFTFGTLVGHAEQGVERFEVSWSPESDEVRFNARAVSRPTPLLRWVAPLARRLQLRFHRESTTSMQAFITRQQPRGCPS